MNGRAEIRRRYHLDKDRLARYRKPLIFPAPQSVNTLIQLKSLFISVSLARPCQFTILVMVFCLLNRLIELMCLLMPKTEILDTKNRLFLGVYSVTL